MISETPVLVSRVFISTGVNRTGVDNVTTGAQISARHLDWFQEAVSTVANLSASIGEFTLESSLFMELTRSAYRTNWELGTLAMAGSGPLGPEFDSEINAITQDLVIMLPLIRMIYNARRHLWFDQNNVLRHGNVYARTWYELVLKTAEEFTKEAGRVNARNACRLLHDSQYESEKIAIHIEVEFERATNVLLSAKAESDRARSRRYSTFREPQEWLRLRKLKGLSYHRNNWPKLVKKHGVEIHCESTKSARISIELATEWGLDLPEFREPMK